MEEKCFCHLNGLEVKDAKARKRLDHYGVTPQMFGAVGDGVADDTNAILAMFAEAGSNKKVYFPNGEYRTTAPIDVPVVPDIEMDGIILSDHAGIALFLGSTTEFTMNKTIKIKAKRAADRSEDGSVGLQIGCFARSTFYLEFINGFETNVKLLVEGGNGFFFNTFHIDDLNYPAKNGLYLDGTDGWINDNLFIGGSIGKGPNGAAITIIHGSQNFFFKNGMEGAGTCVNIITGTANTFFYSRCEASTTALLLGENAGSSNVMITSYADFYNDDSTMVNNSKDCSNALFTPGIRDVCKHTAVNIDFSKAEVLTIGSNIVIPGLKFIDSINAKITYTAPASIVSVENGEIKCSGNVCPVFEFDTTKNKRFGQSCEYGAMITVYTEAGKVELTEENYSNYIKTTHPFEYGHQFNGISQWYNKGAMFMALKEFEVSEDVVKVEIIYTNFTGKELYILTERPVKPDIDDILPVTALPTNGYTGAKISVNGALYIYNGAEWKAV